MNIETNKKQFILASKLVTDYQSVFLSVTYDDILNQPEPIKENPSEEFSSMLIDLYDGMAKELVASSKNSFNQTQAEILTYTWAKIEAENSVSIYKELYKTTREEQDLNGFASSKTFSENSKKAFGKMAIDTKKQVILAALQEGLNKRQITSGLKRLEQIQFDNLNYC